MSASVTQNMYRNSHSRFNSLRGKPTENTSRNHGELNLIIFIQRNTKLQGNDDQNIQTLKKNTDTSFTISFTYSSKTSQAYVYSVRNQESVFFGVKRRTALRKSLVSLVGCR